MTTCNSLFASGPTRPSSFMKTAERYAQKASTSHERKESASEPVPKKKKILTDDSDSGSGNKVQEDWMVQKLSATVH